jgi:hypothetical protein
MKKQLGIKSGWRNCLILAFGLALGVFILGPGEISLAQSSGGGAWQEGMEIAKQSSGLPDRHADRVLYFTLRWIMGVLLTVAIGAFIVSGIMYITAGGDPTKAQRATKMITYSIIGLVIALLSFTFVGQIDMLIRGTWLHQLIEIVLPHPY